MSERTVIGRRPGSKPRTVHAGHECTNGAECHIHVRRTSTQNCTRVHNATSNIDLANWRA